MICQQHSTSCTALLQSHTKQYTNLLAVARSAQAQLSGTQHPEVHVWCSPLGGALTQIMLLPLLRVTSSPTLEAMPAQGSDLWSVVQSKFRGSTASAVGTVDCRSIAAGLENCRFEGPVRIHLPIPNGIGKVDEEGTFSLLIPLPTASQAVRLEMLGG